MAAQRIPNERLRSLLRESGWTQEAFARAVNVAGAEIGVRLGYDRTTVSHWLAGSEPRDPVPRLIAEVFSRRVGRRLTPAAAGFSHASHAARTEEPVDELTELPRQDADPLCHARLARTPYQVLGRVPGWSEQPRVASEKPGLMRVGASEVALLHGAVRHFAAAMDAHGGAHARSALAVYVADTAATWLRAPGSEEVHRHLCMAASRLTFLLARMHADMDAHGLAQRYLTLSLSLANEARHKGMWATTLRAVSAQALQLGHTLPALQCAEAAVSVGGEGAPGAVRAYLYAQLAVARAAVRDARAADEALAHAELALAEAALGESEGPFDAYPVGALAFQSAEAHSRLGRQVAAVRELHRSADARDPLDRRGLALTLSRRAELLMTCGHLEEACATWDRFLGASDGLHSHSVTAAHTRMRSALRPYGRHPAARQLLRGAA